MESKPALVKDLEKKYIKTYEITDFKDLLQKACQKYSKRTAFKVKDENGTITEISYMQYQKDVISLATALIEKGLEGKRICVIGHNSYKWAVSYIAIAIIGVVVPLDKELHIDDIINAINVSKSAAVIGDNKYIQELQQNKPKLEQNDFIFINMSEEKENNLNWNLLINEGTKQLENGNKKYNDIKINPDEMHILLFTSGTTGSVKAVCLSHKNICSNIMSVSGIIDLSFVPRVLSILPIHHTYECTLGYLLVIFSRRLYIFL